MPHFSIVKRISGGAAPSAHPPHEKFGKESLIDLWGEFSNHLVMAFQTENEMRDQPKPFLQHLEELRWTIVRCLAVLVAAVLVCVPFAPVIFKWLCAPLSKVSSHPEMFLRSLDVTGAFSIAMQIVLWSALIISAPILILFIGAFVFPGLTLRERGMARVAFISAFLLFMLGVCLGYFVTLPIAVMIFYRLHAWMGIQAEWTAPSYVSFCMQLLLLFGLAFEVPLGIIVLGYFRLVTSSFLRSKRRHAVVAILILAMVLTPGPDVISQIIMAAPMLVLYEACIWIIRLFERRNST